MSEPGRAARAAGVVSLALVGVVFLFGVVTAALVVAHRPYQVDEVEHVHAAYEMSAGRLVYRDFRQPHNPLLWIVLQAVVDPDQPVASFARSRWVVGGMLALTIALVGWSARRLGGPLAGVAAAGLALAHSTLIERGQEVRPDGPVALCFAGALAIELSGLPRPRRYALEALVLSAAFLFTNKAVFGCFAFGCLWLLSAARERSPRLVLLPMVAWTLPIALAVAIMAWAGNLREFVELNVVSAVAETVGAAEHSIKFGPGPFLAHEGSRNLLFSALVFASMAWAGVELYRRSRGAGDGRSGDGLGFTLFLALVLLGSLWANPFPFPYLHVTVLPALAVLAGAAVGRFAEARRMRLERPAGAALVLALLVAAYATSLPRLVYLASLSKEAQVEALRQVQRLTGPDDAVFDMVGLYFRPDGHFAYLMTGQTFARYRLGMLEPIPSALRRSGTVAFLYSYRIRWLEERDRRFLQEHFTHYDRNLFLLGTPLVDLGPGESRSFEVLVGKRFRHDGDGEILVDGAPFESGFLAAGEHRIERVGSVAADRLILDGPPPHPWPPRPPTRLYVNFD